MTQPTKSDFEKFLKKHRALRRFKRNCNEYDAVFRLFATHWVQYGFVWTDSAEAKEFGDMWKAHEYWEELNQLWQAEVEPIGGRG
jgi:hypothetical protein